MSSQSLADAIAATARQQGATTPQVRRAEWRTATVTAVGSDGTVDCGTIRARRLDSYLNPAVGDHVVISQNGSGNWIACGRLATTEGTAWTAYTPAWTAATTNPSLGNGTLSGRYERDGRTIRGSVTLAIGSSTTGGSGGWFWSLPAQASSSGLQTIGVVQFLRSSPDRYAGQVVISPGNSTFQAFMPVTSLSAAQIRPLSGTGSPLSPSSGATFANSWSSGDQVRITYQYETAA